MDKKENKKKKVSILGIILGILLLLMTISLIVIIKILDVIPNNYFTMLIVILTILGIILNFFLIYNFKNKFLKFIKVFFIIVSIIIIIAYSFGIYYLNKTINLFENISIIKEEVTNYYIVVLDTSIYQEPSDLYEKKLAYYEKTDEKVINSLKLSLDYIAEIDIEKLPDP